MSVKTTPEKVKSLLSSFLASPKQKSTLKMGPIIAEKESQIEGESDNTIVSKGATTTINLRSHDSFLERLDTFSSLTWFGKPSELSPLICARYGWANIDTDSLQCVSCKAHLCGKLPDHTDYKAYTVFKEKLKKDILTAHGKFCVLAANPCPENFCLIPCDDPTSLISDFAQRVTSLESVTCSFPNIDFSTLHSCNYDEGQGAAYCKRLLLPESDTSPEVVALSVTGWSCMPSKTDILMCSKCRRHVGLWNFDKLSSNHTVYNNGNEETARETNGEEKEPDAKMPKTLVKSSFNPVEQHKHWCPWLIPTLPSSTATTTSSSSWSSSSPSPAGGKRAREEKVEFPAFIVALMTIAPGLMDNNTGLAQAMKVSPVADGLRCFRRVMKAWSSPKSISDHLSSSTPLSTKASS